ncbi:MAG: hypothetical protein DRR06_16700 [Gammaproteobacteria bacterium]|nr:MAG: hypothetical protein DRR06_16700 [Gammaproteobacteria bacterium]
MIEITTPASSRDLTTSAELLKHWVGKQPDLDVVNLAITSASINIAHWCRREFVQQEYMEYLEAPERIRLVIAESPIISVSEVIVSGDPVTDYTIFEKSGILLRNDGVPWTGPVVMGGAFGTDVLVSEGLLSITVDYIAGYTTRAMDEANMDLPADLELAAITYAIELINMTLEKPIGDPMSVKVGGFTTEYSDTDTMTGSGSGYWAEAVGDPSMLWLPLPVRRVLMAYRRTL